MVVRWLLYMFPPINQHVTRITKKFDYIIIHFYHKIIFCGLLALISYFLSNNTIRKFKVKLRLDYTKIFCAIGEKVLQLTFISIQLFDSPLYKRLGLIVVVHSLCLLSQPTIVDGSTIFLPNYNSEVRNNTVR